MNKSSIQLEVDLTTKVQNLDNSIKAIQNAIKGYKFDPIDKAEIERAFKHLNSSMNDFSKKSKTTLGSNKEAKNYANDVINIGREYGNLLTLIKKTGVVNSKTFKELVPKHSIKGLEQAESLMGQYLKDVQNLEDAKKRLNNLESKNSRQTNWESVNPSDKRNYTRMGNLMKGTSYEGQAVQKKNIQGAAKELESRGEISAAKELMTISNKYTAQELVNLEKRKTAYNQYNNELKIAQNNVSNLEKEQQVSFDKLKNGLSEIDFDKVLDFSKIKSFEDIEVIINSLTDNDFAKLLEILEMTEDEFEDIIDTGKKIPGAYEGAEQAGQKIDHLTSKIVNFFAVDNMVRLFKRSIRSAYEAIKELDSAMTEQAVVTDFSVGDLWGQLPQYTKQANQLGVATKEAYDAATLYYQQGLKTNQVNQLTTNTLKMARIAGLDAATATDRMTNALRGFNMELDETNSKRVADVYSKLAAVSATDVNELSVAMTKTASIANSANMSFENTAAYLAQMLETTRESAETAGTALKTVIGRFTEVKKLYTEGQLTGSDEEGEVIDVNKVATALRTAGIDMNKFFIGEVGLDEIFNELAEKWDSLSIVQQRYIATQAAGSRQQSRFIAMLGDQKRLTELQADAYNASGASEKQYEKTLDSLETKLNQLKNAWNEFTMGITNSTLVKGGIDILTKILNLINNITTGFGLWSSGSIASSIAKITLGLGGMTVALEGVKKAMTSIKAGSLSEKILKGFNGNFSAESINSAADKLGTPWEGVKGIFTSTKKAYVDLREEYNTANGLKSGTKSLKGIKAGLSGIIGPGGKAALVIAGVAAATYGLYKVWQKNISFNYKLEQINESIERSQKAAEKAKQAYQDLLTSYNTYNQTRVEINNLTAGTRDWTLAIIEANDQTSELLQKYQQLYKYVSIDSNGLMVISEDGWNAAKENYSNYIKRASSAKYVAEASKAQLEKKQLTKNDELGRFSARALGLFDSWSQLGHIFNNFAELTGSTGWLKGVADWFNKNNTSSWILDEGVQSDWTDKFNNIEGVDIDNSFIDDFSTAMLDGKIEDLDEWLSQNLKNYNSLSPEAKNQVEVLCKQLEGDLEEETLKVSNSIMQAAISAASDRVQNSDYGQDIAAGVTADEDYDKKIEEGRTKYRNHGKKWLLQSYMDKTGMSRDEVFESLDIKSADDLTREKWQKELSKLDVAEELGETVDKAFDEVTEHFGEQAELAAKVMKKDTAELTQAQISAIEAGKFSNNDKEALMEAYGFNTIEEVQERINEQLEKSKAAYNTGDSIFGLLPEKISESWENLKNQVDAGSYKEVSQKLYDLYTLLGSEAGEELAESIFNSFSKLTKGLSEEQTQKFYDVVSTMDWSSTDSLANFGESLKAVGLYLPNNEIEKFVDDLKKAGYTFKKIDIAELKDFFNGVTESLKNIKGKNYTDNFSAEEYSNILAAAGQEIANDFIKVGDEYVYLGGSMADLQSAIEQNTEEIIKANIDKLDKEIDKANEGEEAFSKAGVSGDFNDIKIETLTSDQKSEIYNAMTGSSIDFGNENAEGQALINDFLNSLLELIQKNQNGTLQTERDEYVSDAKADSLAMKGSAAAYGAYNDAIIDKDSKAADEASNAMLKLALSYSSCRDEAIELNKAMASGDSEAIKAKMRTAAIAVASAEAQEKIDNLCDSCDDLFERYDNIASMGGDVSDTINEIAVTASNYLGLEISSAFLEEGDNLNLLRQGLEGNYDAWRSFYEGAIQSKLSLDNLGFSAWEVADYVSLLDGISFDINGEADFTQLLTSLEAAGRDVDAFIDAVYKAANLKITVERDESGAIVKATGNSGVVNKRNYVNSFGGRGGRGSGSGGGGNKEWKNELDPLYNLEQDITEEKRIQTILQEELNHLEEDANATGKQKLDNLKKQLDNLEKQRVIQEALYKGRQKQIDQLMSENSKYGEYAWYNKKDHTVEIDWKKINDAVASKKLDEDQYKELTDYISKLEDYEKKSDDAQDALDEIDDSIKEILDYYHDEYVEFENRILDAVVELRQQEIDKLDNLSNAIDDANDKLVDSISNAIDEQRRNRDNENKQKEIEDMESRVAYLSMDTSGANQTEILSLQKQIDDARESYTDTLIDQKINELEQQNEKASQQRQAQIELMQAQLEYEQKNGLLWDEVNNLISKGMDSEGNLKVGSDLYKVISKAENWKELSKTQKADMKDELKEQGSSAWAYLKGLTTIKSDGHMSKTLDNIASKVGTAASGSSGGGGSNGGGGYSYSPSSPPPSAPSAPTKVKALNGTARYGWSYYGGREPYIQQDTTTNAKKLGGSETLTIQSTAGPGSTISNLGASHGLAGLTWYYTDKGWFNSKQVTPFKTGGVADFTGPAWLDGTKSKPEYVLNSTQTAGFLKLVDVLDGFRNGNYNSSTNSIQTYGDFNINIEVDKMANDYDTDKLVKRIKKEIYNNGTYRNFNNVSRLR